MAAKLNPWAKSFTKGNFEQKTQNEGGFVLFLRTKWRISQAINL